MLTDEDRELAELAASHHGVFSLADAVDIGLKHGQIRERATRDWVRCHEGVFRMPGAPETWFSRLAAAAAAAGPSGAISHRSAAALYGLPGGRTEIAEITCVRWRRAQHDGLVVHESRRLRADDISEFEGIAVTCPERIVLDLASIWPSANFVETVIQAARRKRLITFDSTLAYFERHGRRGLRGTSAVRSALERWDPGSRATESEMETLLLQILREHGCPDPVPQFEVRNCRGELVARVDIAIPQWNITIEYDSKQEHSDEFQIERDARRRNRIIGAGYAPLVARHRDLLNGGEQLYDEIVEARRNWRHRVV